MGSKWTSTADHARRCAHVESRLTPSITPDDSVTFSSPGPRARLQSLYPDLILSGRVTCEAPSGGN